MNIYITKLNEERLRNLEVGKWTMSGLINWLLNNYFSTEANMETPIELNEATWNEIKKKQPNKNPELDIVLCPNGHAIPEGRNKCMGKGCKYAG